MENLERKLYPLAKLLREKGIYKPKISIKKKGWFFNKKFSHLNILVRNLEKEVCWNIADKVIYGLKKEIGCGDTTIKYNEDDKTLNLDYHLNKKSNGSDCNGYCGCKE